MWRTLSASQDMDENFVRSATEIGRSTFYHLVYATSGVYLAWHLVATLNWPVTLGAITWGVSALYGLVLGLTLWLAPRRLLAAQWLWQVGLLATIVLAYVLYQTPEVLLLLALLPFVSAVNVSWEAALIMAVSASAVVLWMATSAVIAPIPLGYAVAIAVAGAFTALVGWSSSHALYTVIRWSLFSFDQARENMEEARNHRAQLARVVKDLDQAYHRLERANAALVAAWHAADDAERLRAEFVANVSHELRTPLNLIVGFSEMITTSPESYGGAHIPGPYRSDLNAIYHNARHLLALVDDVLDLARMEAGRIALARDRIGLAELAREATDMVKDYIAAKGLALRVEIEAGLPELSLDRMRIRQVLLNLLVNAARFTEHGEICLRASREGDEIMVHVTDTGRGIPKDDLPHIFEEFRSTEQPLSTWHSGTGLGLPISKKFVEMHHGRMGVDSVHTQGSDFWFALPLGAEPPPETGRWMRGHPTRRMAASERIVVTVHEDPRIAPLLQRHLDGYRVVGADDMTEGIALVEELKALAMIVDGEGPLPAVAGRIPVIRCPLPSGQRAALAVGAEDLLIKPVSRDQLIAALDRLNRPLGRVLVADDDPDVARLFRRMLRNRVAEFMEAHNGREALEMIEANPPDLVILDLMMPEVDGHEVLHHMSITPSMAGIPVVLVTARGQDYTTMEMQGAIQVSRAEGFQLGETMQILNALFQALAPEWH
jgi:signal transduction histidine kinase/CheY-like chemotaxis protein